MHSEEATWVSVNHVSEWARIKPSPHPPTELQEQAAFYYLVK